MASGSRSDLVVVPGLVTHQVGPDIVVVDHHGKFVLTATGPAAEALRSINAGTPAPERLNDAISVLTELGIIAPNHHLSRRQLLRSGFATAAVGITILALPSAAAAASALAAPTGVTATAGEAQVTVNWVNVSGATTYTVEYKASSGSTFATFDGPVTNGPVIVIGLTNDVPYDFRVIANHPGGSSHPSTTATATPRPPFGAVGLLALTLGGDPLSGAISAASSSTTAYFGQFSDPATVTEVTLSTLTQGSTLALTGMGDESGFAQTRAAITDGDHGYFATWDAPFVHKVALDGFTEVAALRPNFAGDSLQLLQSACTDGTNGYFGTTTYFGDEPIRTSAQVAKIRLSDLSQVGPATVVNGDASAVTSSFATGGYGYFATYPRDDAPAQGRIVKVRLDDMVVIDTLDLPFGDVAISSGTDGIHGYFGTAGTRMYKIPLADADDPDTGFGPIANTLEPLGGFEEVSCIVINNDVGFFGTNTDPARIAKVRLSDFTVVGSVLVLSADDALPDTVSYLASAVAADGYGYFGTNGDARVVKVALGP